MRVVEVGSADTHGDVGKTALRRRVTQQAAVSAGENDKILIVHGVTEIVGRLFGLSKLGDGAGEFRLHGL